MKENLVILSLLLLWSFLVYTMVPSLVVIYNESPLLFAMACIAIFALYFGIVYSHIKYSKAPKGGR